MAGDALGKELAQKKERVEEEEDTPKAKDPPKKNRVEEEEDTSKSKSPPNKKKHAEEEEDKPRTKPKRKVIRVEEEEDTKAKSTTKGPSEPTATGDLHQLAEQATKPSIKKLFRSLEHPYDLATFKRTPGVTTNGEESRRDEKIEPIPLYLGNNPARYRRELIRLIPLTSDWQRGKPYERFPDRLELVRHYEEIAQDAVRRFLNNKTDPEDTDAAGQASPYEKLAAAEQVLSSVLRWHESARQTGKRTGTEWSAVEASLRKQLLDNVLLEQMKLLAQAQDWNRVLELTHRLAITYTDPEELKRILHPVSNMIRNALHDPTADETENQKARSRLRSLEREFPGNSAFQEIVNTLRSEALSQVDAGEAALNDKDEAKARRLLHNSRETWPGLPQQDELALKLKSKHPLLRVGIRGSLPRYFSPAWACTDNERRAVDLLFESLVKLIPDEAGGFRYVPGLAESSPRVVPLGRQVELPHNAQWSNGIPLISTDIRNSYLLLRNGSGVGRSSVWGDLLSDVQTRDPFQMTVRLKQGFLDPLALMTFKILPRDQEVNTEEFARNPVTSGPFRVDRSQQSDETSRECLFFTVNPSYGLRSTKRSSPHIEKIRFYTYTNPFEELKNGRLDLLLDLTAKEVQELQEKQIPARLSIEIPLPTANVPNRRIYFLAINNRRVADVKLRRALAFAIDREALLDKHFRADLKTRLHRPINGPFPAGSWACNRDLDVRPNQKGLDLFDADAAKNLSVNTEKPKGLKLKYPQDQAPLKEAMKDLCEQVKKWTGVVLEPTPCDPYQLRKDVEEKQEYDLAYYHYDFPDESYWLAPLFSPPPQTSINENMFRFTNTEITQLLAGIESYRNFDMVKRYQWTIHKRIYEEMPFIPLWQLDPLLVYRREVQPVGLDPSLVFNNIEEWRVAPR